MKTALVLALALISVTASVSVDAQTYQWKDSRGRTVISDTPPPGSEKAAKTAGGNQTIPAEKAPEAAKTMADKDMDFKKRQQEAKAKAEKDAKDQAVANDKRENCDRARRNLAALESSQPLAQLDENGQRKTMDDTQREQEKERARKVMADSCNN